MHTELLHYLAENNATFKPYETTTSKIAKDIKSTQQTVSRWLINLEKEGYLTRNATAKGIAISLTQKALGRLKEEYHILKSVFDTTSELTGELMSGLGEGKYYMSKQQYQMQFREKLGFFPWPGTLNLKVDSTDLRRFLITERPVAIEGFKTEDRTFGGLWCYPVKIEDVKAAIAIPYRTTHPEDIVEIIAPEEIRKKHKISDGDKVKVTK